MHTLHDPSTPVPEGRPVASDTASPGQGAVEFLMRRMRLKADFPAMSEAIHRINELARSESERIDSVSSAILQDFSLTNKILRLVNSSYYRGAHQEPVTTMSRAIMVLGLEAIRSLAVSLALFEHMRDRNRADQLREEFIRANLRASIARSMLGAGSRLSEEAHLAAMFHRLGRLLVMYHFPEEFDEIQRQVQADGIGEETASRRVLDAGYNELGVAVATSWGFAPSLVRSMTVLQGDGPVPVTSSHETHLTVLANFSAELCDLLEQAEEGRLRAGLDILAHRYGKTLDVTAPQVRARLDSAAGQVRELARVLGLNMSHSQVGRKVLALGSHGQAEEAVNTDDPFAPGSAQTVSGGAMATPGATRANADRANTAPGPGPGYESDPGPGYAPDPGPAEETEGSRRQTILTDGLVELSRTLAESGGLNDLVRMAMETLYRGMALRNVIFALHDARAHTLNGRLGFGPGMPGLARAFRVPVDDAGDLFAAAMRKNADLLIRDSTAENIVSRIPLWFREHFNAGSFIVLPLSLHGKPVGMIYADQPQANQIRIGEQEMSLVRAIRNQVVLAFMQARSG